MSANERATGLLVISANKRAMSANEKVTGLLHLVQPLWLLIHVGRPDDAARQVRRPKSRLLNFVQRIWPARNQESPTMGRFNCVSHSEQRFGFVLDESF
jgi:hypothetical protein